VLSEVSESGGVLSCSGDCSPVGKLLVGRGDGSGVELLEDEGAELVVERDDLSENIAWLLCRSFKVSLSRCFDGRQDAPLQPELLSNRYVLTSVGGAL